MARRKNISVLRKRNIQRYGNQAISKKGMELPINTLVVVAIAVIVILAIAAFFMGGFGGSSKDVQNRQNFLNSCSAWTQSGCNNDDYNPSIKDAFLVWQPTQKEQLDDKTETEQKDYLASKCGCFGAGTGTRSSTTTTTGTGATTGLTCTGTGYRCFSGDTCSSTETKDTTKTCLGTSICCKTTGGTPTTPSPPTNP